MWRCAFLPVLEFVIALPDHTAVFGSRMPHFRAEETATAGADDFCRENAASAILFAESFSSFYFCLYQLILLRGNDRIMTVFHEILRNFTLVDFLFFRQEIHGKFLLE